MPIKKYRLANLRVCASCKWIYRLSDNPNKDHEHWSEGSCPQCGFGSYGARYVYGKRAYQYAITQKPWFDEKLFSYEMKLLEEIDKNPIKKKSKMIKYII